MQNIFESTNGLWEIIYLITVKTTPFPEQIMPCSLLNSTMYFWRAIQVNTPNHNGLEATNTGLIYCLLNDSLQLLKQYSIF